MRRTADRRSRSRGIASALVAVALLASAPAHRALGSEDVVSFGKATDMRAPVSGSLVSVGGDVTLRAPVSKDLIVLGGNAVLAPGAQVRGDILVLGGTLRAEQGSARSLVAGEIHTVQAVEAAFLAEVQTSPAAGEAPLGLLLSLRLALLVLWLVIAAALLYFAPRRLLAAAGTLPGATALDALLGAVAVLAGVLVSAFLISALPPAPALAVTAVLLVALMAAKAFGLAVLFVRLGRRLAAGRARGSVAWGDPAALALGLVALGGVSLIPLVGPVVWIGASLVAIGVALGTGFGKPLESGHLTLSARRA